MIWRPDSCKCRLEFDGINDVEHFIRAIEKCPAHASVADKDITIDILSENKTKNRLLHHIMETRPELVDITLDGEGNEIKDFKPGMRPVITFDSSRNVKAAIPSLNAPGKSSLQSALDTRMNNDVVLTALGRKKNHSIE